MENGAAQAKSEDQNIHGTVQYNTGAICSNIREAKL
jgi:hypothetical protein